MLFILYVILSSLGIILFKLGSSDIYFKLAANSISLKLSFVSILGLICYIVSFLLWMAIISKSDVHIIVPIGLGMTNIAILLGSYFVLGEQINMYSVIGACLIIFGTIIINKG